MIDDNIIMCKRLNSEKCIRNELWRNNKYYTYMLLMLEAYNEEDNSLNLSQLIRVTIKIFFTFIVIFFTKKIFSVFIDDFFKSYLNIKLVADTRRKLYVNQGVYYTLTYIIVFTILNILLTSYLFYLRF